MKSNLEVALLLELESDWHRNIVKGVADYAQSVGNWRFVVPGLNESGDANLPPDWSGDGVIIRRTGGALEQQVAQLGLPTVNVSWLSGWSHDVVNVVSDAEACARIAAQYYIDKQLQNFSYIGFEPGSDYQPTIEETLRDCFSHSDFGFDVFDRQGVSPIPHGLDLDKLRDWLVALPKPNGVIVWSSEVGRLVTQLSLERRIIVPDEISVLCIEHDSLWSSLADIPLSNVDQDPWRVGYSAGRVLYQMMTEQQYPGQVSIPPIGISQRQSSNSNAVADVTLKRAMQYIKNNVHLGISVNEVAIALDVSRRTLESKFKDGLKNSPGTYIRRIQLQKAANMLRRTSLTLPEIAERTGFSYTTVLMRAFKREYGVTPMQFRGNGGR